MGETKELTNKLTLHLLNSFAFINRWSECSDEMMEQGYIMNRRDIYNKYTGHCAYCGKKIEFDDMTIDHIVPQSKGGKNTDDNIVPCCQLCNSQKANRSLEEFRAFLENITDTLDEDKQYRLALRYKKVAVVKPSPVVFFFEREK